MNVSQNQKQEKMFLDLSV